MNSLLPRLDTALEERGITANAASKDAGYPGIIANWRRPQSPTVRTLTAVSNAIHIDPAWLIKEDPKPIAPPSGFRASPQPLDQPDTLLGVAYSAWKADDGRLEARFFGALEMIGLIDAVYLIRRIDGDLVYNHIGQMYRKTLGTAWWVAAHGRRVSEDPDPAFSAWCLAFYDMSMSREEPLRHRCIVVSRYTAVETGWDYERLVLPVDGGICVVNQVT